MKDLAIQFKFLYEFALISHHNQQFPTFISDHEWLADIYEEYEGIYDSIIERLIGTGQNPNEFEINSAAIEKLNQYKDQSFSKNADYFKILLQGEKEACSIINSYFDKVSVGTQDLIASIADDSEVRQYKFQQRLAAE